MPLGDGQYREHGLQDQANKAIGRSFVVDGSFAYSKKIDTGGGSDASEAFPACCWSVKRQIALKLPASSHHNFGDFHFLFAKGRLKRFDDDRIVIRSHAF
jgi:hypothetical protein